MHLTSYLDCGILTIALTGEIDHHCAKSYISAISSKIEAYTPNACILDFEEVTFMDSSGIAVIINSFRAMTRMDGILTIAGLREQPMKVVRTAGIDKIVKIEERVR